MRLWKTAERMTSTQKNLHAWDLKTPRSKSAAENLHLTGYGTFSPYYGTDFIEILVSFIHKNEWFNKKIMSYTH